MCLLLLPTLVRVFFYKYAKGDLDKAQQAYNRGYGSILGAVRRELMQSRQNFLWSMQKQY